jgi:serine protease Do
MRTTRHIFSGLILLAVATFAAVPGHAQRAAPDNREQVMLSFAPLVRAASPAVVNVFTRKAVRSRGPASPLFNDPFFRRFFGDSLGLAQPRERIENSLGSGVIVRSDGLIVTNFHVIEGADAITIVLSDRREFEATILREDERTDLAILKIDAGDEELPNIALSNSDDLEVGDLVLAIGNPFGVGKTVTSGIVSGLAPTRRSIPATPAAHCCAWTARWPASTRRSSRAAAAARGSDLPYRPAWCEPSSTGRRPVRRCAGPGWARPLKP